MKISYTVPSIEVIRFDEQDVLKASGIVIQPTTSALVIIAEDPLADAQGDGDILSFGN